MFLPSNSALRKTAIGFATAAMIGVSSIAPLGAQQMKSTPVVATTTDEVTATTDCKTWKPGELGGSHRCEILKGKLLDAQFTQEKANLACMQKVKVFFDQGKVSRETITKFGENRMCDLLKTLG